MDQILRAEKLHIKHNDEQQKTAILLKTEGNINPSPDATLCVPGPNVELSSDETDISDQYEECEDSSSQVPSPKETEIRRSDRIRKRFNETKTLHVKRCSVFSIRE